MFTLILFFWMIHFNLSNIRCVGHMYSFNFKFVLRGEGSLLILNLFFCVEVQSYWFITGSCVIQISILLIKKVRVVCRSAVLPFCHPAISTVHSVVLQFQLLDLANQPPDPTRSCHPIPPPDPTAGLRFHHEPTFLPSPISPPPVVQSRRPAPAPRGWRCERWPRRPTAVTTAAMLAFVRRHAHIAQPNPLPLPRHNDILQLRRPPFPHPLQRAAQRPPPLPPAASTRPPPHRSSTSTVPTHPVATPTRQAPPARSPRLRSLINQTDPSPPPTTARLGSSQIRRPRGARPQSRRTPMPRIPAPPATSAAAEA
jgi:hypothetical protein